MNLIKVFFKIWGAYVILAIIIVALLFAKNNTPMNEQTKTDFNTKQELIEQDFSNILNMSEATGEITEDQIIVNLKADKAELKLVYDKPSEQSSNLSDNLVQRKLTDTRFGKRSIDEKIAIVLFCIIIGPAVSAFFTSILLDIILDYVNKRRKAKKDVKNNKKGETK